MSSSTSQVDKILVKICVGTACFVLGASELQDIAERVPAEWLDRVEFRGVNCLGICKDNAFGRAPCVMINDEILSEATPSRVIERLQQLLDA